MISYEVKPFKETVIYLQTFEDAFLSQIKATIEKINQRNWDLDYSICLEKKKKDINVPFLLSNENASFELKDSLVVIDSAKNFLDGKTTELSAVLSSDQILHIEMLFKRKEIKEQPKKKQNSDESQPYFCPINPIYNFSQMILPETLLQEIHEAMDVIRYKELIYNEWGFNEVDSIPKSVLNFYGPPGTGKTMCAHALANELGKKLLALNYAEIESKYLGDSAKNLQRAFDIAQEEDCVLFFDEADSFLGKRIENVQQGSDQALNSLRSQMLILLEQFSGIVIFATNLVTNYDRAFESRILKHLKFDLPNEEARMAIIRKDIPQKLPMTPLTDEEIRELSKICEGNEKISSFSGREIKNAILDTLIKKASVNGDNSEFNFSDFKNAFENRKKTLETLHDEELNRKKNKIKAALSRQSDEIADTINKKRTTKKTKTKHKRQR